jgi:hypothetical protein
MRDCHICHSLEWACTEDSGQSCVQEVPEEDQIGGAAPTVKSFSCEQCKQKNGHCLIGQYDQDSRLIACPY